MFVGAESVLRIALSRAFVALQALQKIPDTTTLSRMHGMLKCVATYLALSPPAALLGLLYIYLHLPTTETGWGLIYLIALPVTLLGERIGERAWRNPFANAISAQTSKRSLSGLRILYTLVVMLVAFGLVLGVFCCFGAEL